MKAKNDSKREYLNFYNENFVNGKFCTKSWGFAVWEFHQKQIEKIKKESISLLSGVNIK